MLNKRLIILFSILIILIAIVVMIYLPPFEYAAIGSLFGAVGGLLAVIWFSASLYYQSLQLKEQKSQFIEQFNQLREDSRKNALFLAKDILREAEERALKQNSELNSIGDLTAYYFDISDLTVVLKSKDPVEVRKAYTRWFQQREGPAMFLLRGIKQAANIYFLSIGKTDVDYSIEPEDFVLIYGSWLWKLPFFGTYQAVATMLCEFMVRIQPGRKAALLAVSVALMKINPEVMKTDKIHEDIKRFHKEHSSLPVIAEDIWEEIKEQ